MNIMDFTPGVSPTGGFCYPAIAVKLVEPGICIHLQHTAEAGKMVCGWMPFLSGCTRTTPPGPALTRRCDHHEHTSTTARSSSSYYLATAPGLACHRRGACRQPAHSSEAPLPVGTAAGNMHQPSPTGVNDSVPHPGGRIFQTGDTAVCALHTLRSVRGPASPGPAIPRSMGREGAGA